ncbi:isoleucine--tRNA ligase [Sphingomicrobium aestuariivivum]|uniref:isoleucine--tRNA ligase n=1 Tax=Sphingomicrobium aestuariivivum TaxID=1582356 RepID=UPI001FD6E24D|nr:isoleucine--tRNA ligase [Sphingomicrobium aestuariivivum]MCJ8190721.1 isoleucine--tRNA ligase [Sphingomicrobium aestuariivivum]
MSDKPNYKDTVFLPKTDFPMKAGLPQKEPKILARWQAEDIYGQVREARAGAEKFILHDGPPYANGDIHIGHALNKTIKDVVVRSQTLLGKDAPYVPGWDCHGLPIEWKIEEKYRKKKKDKKDVAPAEFRAECRAYAAEWVEVQAGQFQRLGNIGEWDKPYLTMRPEAEAGIVAELFKFAETGQLYRGSKPVMWSPVEETALAEAEVEYQDLTDSPQIDVAFEIVESKVPELVGAYAVIWTTTPWTIPVNQALSFGPEIDYALVEADGRRFIVGVELLEAVAKRTGMSFADVKRFKGKDLEGTIARHPMHELGGFYAKPRPLLAGDFVTTDSGTGIVHMAPDHGEDDFKLCKSHGIEPVFAVERDGTYRDDWLWLGGDDERRRSVINKPFNSPEGPICSDLREAGALLSASADYQHSYPHSWRSKAKVIYRCTPQWFIAMDKPLGHLNPKTPAEKRWEDEGGPAGDTGPISDYPTLREAAMEAIDKTRFYPERGRNRIGTMVADRPDWLISRQRAWGVPIALFVERKSGELLVDADVNARIVEAMRAEGVDAWREDRAQHFLGDGRDPADYEMVTDILDVWFDSGSTHAFVLESGEWPDLSSPADLYLEGSDQHRGWFQSSLLESCGTRGRAPYKALLTHGFTMDAKGMKMSKSLGNTISPLKVMEQYGADIIRLWAMSVDYTEDHRIGDEILRGVGDQYRKLRNSLRYLLGALVDYDPANAVPAADMPELERYMLHRIAEVSDVLRAAAESYDFNRYVRTLVDFAQDDLSSFFFDIRKDRLYCDVNAETGEQTHVRAAYRTVLDVLFHGLVRWLSPILVFTAEEAWTTRYPEGGSVHTLSWPEIEDGWKDDKLAARWTDLRDLRARVTEAIEPYRKDKVIRSSLQAEVTVDSAEDPDFLAELFISGPVHKGDGLKIETTNHAKCGRCWRHLPEVDEDGDLCGRCEEVLK